MAVVNGIVQRSEAAVVDCIDVGAMRNQSLDFAKLAVECRPNERRIAFLVAFVDICIASNDFDFA